MQGHIYLLLFMGIVVIVVFLLAAIVDQTHQTRKVRKRSSWEQLIVDRQQETSMVQQGWRIWPENTTDEQRKEAIEHYLKGGTPIWYPEGYVEQPIDNTGKIQER